MRAVRLLLGAVTTVVVLAGCGTPDAGQPGAAPTAPSSGTTSTRPGVELPDPTVTGRERVGGTVRLTGVVTAGVESGCRLLTAGGATYLLVGGPEARVGERVTVVGTVAPGLRTTCQQGVPLRVHEVLTS